VAVEIEGRESVSANRWHLLDLTEDGYGIWRREDPAGSAPIAVFDDDADGFTAANAEFRRRTRQMRLFSQFPEVLAWVVAVGVILWFLTVLISTTTLFRNNLGGSSRAFGDLLEWSEEFMQVAYALWLGALALMVMLWLLRRARDEPRIG
jgi:hypothetical protein